MHLGARYYEPGSAQLIERQAGLIAKDLVGSAIVPPTGSGIPQVCGQDNVMGRGIPERELEQLGTGKPPLSMVKPGPVSRGIPESLREVTTCLRWS